MNNVTVIGFLLITLTVVLSSAYPSTYYGYGNNYESDYGYGYVDYDAPRYGSGYDQYVYGYYDGHPGNYDYYGKIYDDYHGNGKAYQQTPYAYGHTYGRY